jgi:hypothetical protein
MLKHLGFGDKWVTWIDSILKSDSTYVLLNGVPGKRIICKRGVRQGDPLSPLLFVTAIELLQYIINDASQNGVLNLPLHTSFGLDYPTIQYADDTLLILPACPDQLLRLKDYYPSFPPPLVYILIIISLPSFQ